jgi:hypothetical protein
VFLEPRKAILSGQRSCRYSSIGRFFSGIISFLAEKKASIIPLNPEHMLSHRTDLIFEKTAMQLSEEEYMAELIIRIAKLSDKRIIVLIGNIHAERLKKLLNSKGHRAIYHDISENRSSQKRFQDYRAALSLDVISGRSCDSGIIRWHTRKARNRCTSLLSRSSMSEDHSIYQYPYSASLLGLV